MHIAFDKISTKSRMKEENRLKDITSKVSKLITKKQITSMISLLLCLATVAGLSASALSLSSTVSAVRTEAALEASGGEAVMDYIPVNQFLRLSYEEPDLPLLMDAAPSSTEITISVENRDGELFVGYPFEVTLLLQEEGAEPVVIVDEDCDGIIRYEEPTPGVYILTLSPVEGYISPEPLEVTVEKPIEHKRVEVDVKKATQQELASEDASYGQGSKSTGGGGAPVITDTVEWVESTQTVVKGEEVEREVKDANGNTIYLSKPTTVADGDKLRLVLADGSTSDVFVVLNKNKTIKRAYVMELSGVGGPDGEPGTDPQPDPEPDPQPDPEPDPQPDPEPDPQPDPEPDPQPDPEPDPQPDPEPDPDPNPEPDPDPNPEPDPQPQPDPVYVEVDVTSWVITSTGYPVEKDGSYVYKFDSVKPKTEKVAEEYIKYTGWQTIDGKTYYFDKNGNKVTGTQIIQGKQVVFGEDGVLVKSNSKGIDVSQWNCYSTIDWNAVKASGVDFVIIRCGLRGSTLGGVFEDSMFRTNMAGAKAAGLKVGVYFFTLAATEEQAVIEASACIKLCSMYSLEYPIFMDVEDPTASGAQASAYMALSRAQRTQVVNAFCDTVRNSGYRAGVYANKYWLSSKISTGSLSGSTVIWLAHYVSQTDYSGRYEMWQYSPKGSVPGISGDVDMNISYLGY